MSSAKKRSRIDTERNIYKPGEDEFIELSPDYDKAVILREYSCDTETPISAFLKLGDEPYSFLLESAEGGERWGRYSFLGCDPYLVITCEDGGLEFPIGTPRQAETGGNPVRFLFSQLKRERVFEDDPNIPFCGGAVGYVGYDLLPYMEAVEIEADKDLELPEMTFLFTRKFVVFDHFLSRLRVCAVADIPENAGEDELRRSYGNAVGEIESLARKLERAELSEGPRLLRDIPPREDFADASSNMTRDEFEEMVQKGREYIYEGDVYQVVLSQRFSTPISCRPFSIYRRLRAENPSPYMFYLNFGSHSLVGSSPEPHITRRGHTAVIRPIAGTRRRGTTEEEDGALEEELKGDEKERAEHIMLVDLARNDLGRVCAPGSVEVSHFIEVERYSHVMHMVSEVQGTVDESMSNYDLLRASFPAGTVSGAPKVRACQIIDELEKKRRGPYAGVAGYLSYNGDMDTCIAIRTIVVNDGMATVQAGAGIVADSVPANEYEETRNKARAMIRAIKMAENGGGQSVG